jgi:hypothetical protein
MIEMNSRPWRLLLAGLPLLLSACDAGQGDAPGAVETHVRGENGVVRVGNTGIPHRWESAELVRIGVLEGTGPDVFGQVRSVVADGESNIYVADGQAREIRVFDPEGRILRTIGREGAGPGEFRNLVGIAWVGESLAAMDPGNGRVQLLDPRGRAGGSYSATPATGAATLFHPQRVGDREFWVPDFRQTDAGLARVFVRYDADGPHDTLPGIDPPPDAPSLNVLCRGEDFFTSFRFPSAPELVTAFAEEGRRLASWTDSYRFAILGPEGDTLRVVSWDRPPVPMDDDAWAEETAEYREFRSARPSAQCEPSSPRRPSHRSTLRHLTTDDAGRVWVESAIPEGFVWDVFDAEGAWIAEVRLPERHAGVPPYVRSGMFYQVERDDFDVQYVAGYRIAEDAASATRSSRRVDRDRGHSAASAPPPDTRANGGEDVPSTALDGDEGRGIEPDARAVRTIDAFRIMAEVDRLASLDLWPGFDPRAIPVAIFDGERTLLFRHPSPPDGFVDLPDMPKVRAFLGRHPQVTANSSVLLEGVWTATLMPPASSATAGDRAALLIHEVFHVHQRTHHPSWSANEVELFTYPVDDRDVLARRRLEMEALRRALGAEHTAEAGCWAAEALSHRSARYALLSEGAIGYERTSELNEGLATYVEHRAKGTPDADLLSEHDVPPEAVRQGTYHTGAALGRLLDHFEPAWRRALADADDRHLDRLLGEALGTGPSEGCVIPENEHAEIVAGAARDIAKLVARREQERSDLLDAPGRRVVVVAGSQPLFPQGFDPLNVQTVRPGEILHTRFLRVGNDHGFVEVMGRRALTEAAGDHPLFNGVRTVTLTGLPGDPVMERDGVIVIEHDSVRGEFRGGHVERSGTTTWIRLAS